MLDPVIARWLTGLRMHQQGGVRSPHKPVLLLAVLELAETGGLPVNAVPFSPALFERFEGYWQVVRGDTPGRIEYPFWHLKSEPFWTLVPKPAHAEDLARARDSPSVARLTDWVAEALLDPRLFDALQLAGLREEMRALLIATYFPEHTQALLSHRQLEAEVYTYEQHIQQVAEAPLPYPLPPRPVRATAFRRVVLEAYSFTCAVSRVRLTTPQGGQLVEAAHIHRWADSRDDRPHNGLALSPTYHWLFDQGLFTLDEQYRVLVSPVARDCAGSVEQLLEAHRGAAVLLPTRAALQPGPEALAWHRAHCFRRV